MVAWAEGVDRDIGAQVQASVHHVCSASNNIIFTSMLLCTWFMKTSPPPQRECTPLLVSNQSFDGLINLFVNIVNPKLPYP
jgi:hypothetical protein